MGFFLLEMPRMLIFGVDSLYVGVQGSFKALAYMLDDITLLEWEASLIYKFQTWKYDV